jgi:hypothetical protein
MVIGDRLKELRESKNFRKAILRNGQVCCGAISPALKTGIPFQRFRRSKRWHAPSKYQCTSSFMKAKLPCQFARRNVRRAVRSGGARATTPTTCPSCAGYLRRWGLASKNSCSTWPKKSRSVLYRVPDNRRAIDRWEFGTHRQRVSRVR